MANFWCVEPTPENVDVLELAYGGRDFKLWVKKELTIGEQRAVETAGFSRVSTGAKRGPVKAEDDDDAGVDVKVDWKKQSFMRTLVYVTDWTLTDEAGNKMPITREVIETLRPAVFDVIEKALNAHVERVKAVQGNGPQAGASAPQQMSA